MTGISASRSLSLPFALTLILVLAACSSGDYLGRKPPVEPNIVPIEYKKEITDTLTKTLEDPTNVRGAYISEPALRPAGRDPRYTVCIRFDSRDGARRYTGSKDHIAYFYGGHLNQLVDATKEQCGNAVYKPFPELEKLCLGKTCE